MKKLTIIGVLLLIAFYGASGQDPRPLTEKELTQLKNEIEIQSKNLRTQLEEDDSFISDYQKEISIEFTVDTFKIEKVYGKRIDVDYSTKGMVNATHELKGEYDKLLNKYYKILVSKLSPSDQLVLKEAQRSWIAYRDNESKLIGVMSKGEYSGGGTIQRMIVSSSILTLTKERVFQLVSHLSSIADE
ncbi:lysozyme inhibitor LprI family protein [Pontibacter virosus]|uniref:Uncharacterized protein DUF1311 n=1 Tax=Pontibacter virosus TaxID=1765052 RepID=A0A2U1AZU2_9BACT|nr:lysozyme inhibitor LprI family protein [Pontibacter virosus]PVY41954.1 uncharacterized protein DUF1311 [Pontibacter virosus]